MKAGKRSPLFVGGTTSLPAAILFFVRREVLQGFFASRKKEAFIRYLQAYYE